MHLMPHPSHSPELCPLQYTCMVGQMNPPYKPYTNGPTVGCPSFAGTFRTPDGFYAINCTSDEQPVIPCPGCRDPHSFKQRDNTWKNWLCKKCGFYVIPPEVQTHFERIGRAVHLKCKCGQFGWLIPDPSFYLNEISWQCSRCGEISRVDEILVNRKDPL